MCKGGYKHITRKCSLFTIYSDVEMTLEINFWKMAHAFVVLKHMS